MTLVPHAWLRCLLAAMVAFQAVAPGALMARAGSQADVNSLICAPSGQLSQVARQAASDLLDLIQQEHQQHISDAGHCPLCVIAGLATLPEWVGAALVNTPKLVVGLPGTASFHSTGINGPPLGGRAPPSFH
ncbi:MAG: DUF2946 family protein [Pseudomonadota bacterium]